MSVITKTIELDVPVAAAYEQWSRFEQFPHFMEGVEQVDRLSDTALRWHVRIGGIDRTFTAEITEQQPNQVIAWRSTEHQHHAGTVRFTSIGEASTQVEVEMDYDPQSWTEKVGDALNILDRRVQEDLQRFKSFIEEREGAASTGKPGDVRSGGLADQPPSDDPTFGDARPSDQPPPQTGGIPGGAPPDPSEPASDPLRRGGDPPRR